MFCEANVCELLGLWRFSTIKNFLVIFTPKPKNSKKLKTPYNGKLNPIELFKTYTQNTVYSAILTNLCCSFYPHLHVGTAVVLSSSDVERDDDDDSFSSGELPPSDKDDSVSSSGNVTCSSLCFPNVFPLILRLLFIYVTMYIL